MDDDLEPIDLEPIDLEPVDLEPAEDEARFERTGPRRPRAAWAVWAVVAAVGLATWAVIGLATNATRSHPSSAPTSTAPATPTQSFTPQADRVIVVAPRLRAQLQDVGVGRFAAVINDQLYVLDENRSTETRVRLPAGHVTIDDQNGQLLLATTFQQTLVSTQPISTHTLSARDFAIPAWAPTRWWILNSDGTIRTDAGGARLHIPDGLRVAAAIAGGFVALDDVNGRWVLWAGPNQRRIAPAGEQLLATGPQTIVFRRGCGYNGCSVDILDVAHGTTSTTVLSRIPNFAALSPDGTRLALSSTQSDVFIVSTRSGRVLVRTGSLESGSPSQPFTWTPDSRALLIVQDDGIEIRRAIDGRLTSRIPHTNGLEQLVALP
jgi:hypothetical protein